MLFAPLVTPEIINSLIADDMKQVDAVIRHRLESNVVLIRQVADYIIGSGGKRLRPALVILSAGSCGYAGRHHHELAAVVEFIHTATLLHDDVVDDSHMRRGRATANSTFGNAAAVLVGDFLYSRAFQMMVDVQNMRIMEVLADATNTIAEGEVMQLLHVHNADVKEQDYLRVIRAKTAKLFEAAGSLGAILAGAPPERERALADYGMHLGTAFQLVDDILDYSGDLAQTGKNLGDDLAQGKTTLPIIYAMGHGSAKQGAIIRNALIDGGLSNFEPVVKAMRDTGALEYTRTRAEASAREAREAIAKLPDSKYRDSLLELATFAVTRKY
ncbi:MAG TPA: polyprenyl synthetase family protein [Burkholderiales bacterium]|nr:polyprenyl synthetase family protein [Burkholderiales bacterium]